MVQLRRLIVLAEHNAGRSFADLPKVQYSFGLRGPPYRFHHRQTNGQRILSRLPTRLDPSRPFCSLLVPTNYTLSRGHLCETALSHSG